MDRGSVSGRPLRMSDTRNGTKRWSAVLASVVVSGAAAAVVGVVFAFLYPIIKELRAERVPREDGTQERMLGVWSILVLSGLAGSICCLLTSTLTYLNSQQPLRHESCVDYGVAILNGIMATLAVIWGLT